MQTFFTFILIIALYQFLRVYTYHRVLKKYSHVYPICKQDCFYSMSNDNNVTCEIINIEDDKYTIEIQGQVILSQKTFIFWLDNNAMKKR